MYLFLFISCIFTNGGVGHVPPMTPTPLIPPALLLLLLLLLWLIETSDPSDALDGPQYINKVLVVVETFFSYICYLFCFRFMKKFCINLKNWSIKCPITEIKGRTKNANAYFIFSRKSDFQQSMMKMKIWGFEDFELSWSYPDFYYQK